MTVLIKTTPLYLRSQLHVTTLHILTNTLTFSHTTPWHTSLQWSGHSSTRLTNYAQHNEPNQMGMTPQHFHTISTPCAILPNMLCALLVVCIGQLLKRQWGGQCWVGSAQLLLSIAGMVCLVCRNCRVHEQCWVYMVCWSVSYVVNLLLLNMVDTDFLLCGMLSNEQC